MDSENTVPERPGGIKEDYVLNDILLGASDPEYKPQVIIGIESKEPYETDTNMMIRDMPHPAQGGGKKSKEAHAMATNWLFSGIKSSRDFRMIAQSYQFWISSC